MSRYLSSIIEPLALTWLLLCLPPIWLACRRRWRYTLVAAIGPLLLFLIGSLPWPESLVGASEAKYAHHDYSALPQADAVVVLGGGYYRSANDMFGVALLHAGSRLITGIELARQGKAKILVLGGSVADPTHPQAPLETELAQNWVRQWRLTDGELLNLGACQNTREEALRIKALQDKRGWKSLLLVTSALHLPRAEALLRKLQVPVIPVPCDFQVAGVDRRPWRSFPFPSLDRFDLLALYLHEVAGWWGHRLRGWL